MSLFRRVHTPTTLQLEAVECGAASLGMILGYYGRWVPLTELRRQCGVSRDGSKASKVVAAAKHYGLQAKGFSKDIEALKTMKSPFIVFWQFNHFLVVERMTKTHVYLNDPACGHRKVTQEEFNYGYTGVVLQMAPGPDFKRGGRQPSLWPGLSKRLWPNLKPLAYCFLAGLLLALPNMALPVFASIFIDSIVLGGRISWFKPLLMLLTATALLQLALKYLEVTYLRRLRLALMTQLSSKFFWHLLRLPMPFYAQRYPGEVSYRFHANHRVADILSGKLATIAISLVTITLYAVVMFYYSVLLTSIGIAFAAVNFIALRLIYRQRAEANLRTAQDSGTVAAVAMAGIQGIETLKASGMEMGFFAKWSGFYCKAATSQQQLEGSGLSLGVLPQLLEGLSMLLILVLGGYMVIQGQMSIGALVAFQALMHNFLSPVGELVDLSRTLQDLEGQLHRLDDVLLNPTEETPVVALSPSSNGDRPARLQGTVEVRDMTFGYSPLEPPLISNFTLRVLPGQRVALVGGSGSGKSTIAKIITGLYEPWQGEIAFDGQPRKQVPRPILDNSIAFVDQDILLFEGTIRDNLTLWDRTVVEESLLGACRDALIDDVIFALPGGLDATLLEGGVNLSGGQRQRLEIARALVNNPSVLVLDEATSALDAETEHIINENLRRRGCTCVVVAHRLSTIRDSNEIIVLRYGEVVERGTHDELWAKQGTYAQLIHTEEQ
jgi:ATP-binding cassette subfamily C protein